MARLSLSSILALCLLLVCFGFAMRLLPHAANLTPITALALVGGMYIGRAAAILLPLLALLLSDLFIGFYSLPILISVYGSFLLIGLLGGVLYKKRAALPVFGATIAAPTLFFIVTNGAVWAFSPWYEKSLSGLLYAYELGIPFFRTMLFGDLLYTTLLIVSFETALYLVAVQKRASRKVFVTG